MSNQPGPPSGPWAPAPRPISASTAPVVGAYGPGSAYGRPSLPPPRRRRRGLAALAWTVALLTMAGAITAIAVVAVRVNDDAEDRAAEDRVEVSTDLHGGFRWTMSTTPSEEERTNVLPDGSPVTVSMWAANPDGLIEVVGIFERRPTFDIDQAMAGTGLMFGEEATDVETVEVDGHPARTGRLAGITAMGDGSATGRITLVLTDTSVVMVAAIGDDRRAGDVDDLHDDDVASVRFD
jgi:hypothetical protein